MMFNFKIVKFIKNYFFLIIVEILESIFFIIFKILEMSYIDVVIDKKESKL